MNIVDILMIILLLSYILKGFKNGAIKEGVTFAGGIVVLILAYILKNPLSVYMYQNLPFFKLGGILSGISVANILIYELIAFLGVAAILLIVYRIVLFATNVLETILKVTVILEIPSKIIGLLVGFVEGVTIIFFILFIGMQFDVTREYIDASKYGNMVLTKTPILSSSTEKVYKSMEEIYDLANKYKDSEDRDSVNLEALDILLKYKVIEPNNAMVLVNTGKLKIDGVEDLINKYY